MHAVTSHMTANLRMFVFLSRPAIEHFTQRVFMLRSEVFFPKHTLMLSTLRKALVPAELAQHMQRLAVLMRQRLQSKAGNMGKVLLQPSFSISATAGLSEVQAPLFRELFWDTVPCL